MQVTAAAPIREYEKPMSWARAIAIATGFFFIAAIFLGQVPSYVFTVSTSATLLRFEQGFLSLGLLSLGLGLCCLEVALLYDPRPVIPWPLFALVGLGLAAVGAYMLLMISLGAWPVNGFPDSGYLISPIWFQAKSIDLAGVGLDALLTGLGMFTIAALNPWVLSGRAFGPLRDLLVRFFLGLAVVLVTLYTIVLAFFPAAIAPYITDRDQTGKVTGHHLGAPYPPGNIVLFLAVASALLGLLIWLLPIMVANRQQFMPGVYFHGVVNLIGQVAVPLLIAWVVAYPLVYAIHQVDDAQFWVQCSQKKAIPASCSFTQFTGYLICAIVFTALFQMLILGIYFWSTRRNFVVIGGTISLIWLALAVVVLHTQWEQQLGAQVPTSLLIGACVIVLAFLFTWATQREFAPTRATQLGCTGQWLVFGTLMLIFLFGYALFSVPQVFELESGLALFFKPGPGELHDAVWGILLMGGLALYQLTLLVVRRPMSDLRKLALWSMLVGVLLMVSGMIIGFTHDAADALFSGGWDAFVNALEGGHVVFLVGLVCMLFGVVVALMGAWGRARSLRWALIILVSAGIGVAIAAVIYSLSYPPASIVLPDFTALGIILMSAGAFAYTALGPDYPGEVVPVPRGDAASATGAPFAVTPRG